MRKIVLVVVTLFCIGLAWQASAAESNATKTTAPDFAKTRKLLDSWAARDRFPDSVTFAYEQMYARLALGMKVDEKLKTRVVDFIGKCQTPSGGFVSEPKYDTVPSAANTWYALRTLDLLGAKGNVDRAKAAKFVLSLQDKTGGFKPDTRSKAPDLRGTCTAVMALSQAHALDKIDKDKVASYLMKYRQPEEGFGMLIGKPSSTMATSMAVEALTALDRMPPETRAGVVKYLKSTRYSGLIKDKKYTTIPMLNDMTAVVAAFSDLDALKEADTQAIRHFVLSLYVPNNGGFGPEPDYGTTPPSTYQALFCLVKLGDLKDPGKPAAKETAK